MYENRKDFSAPKLILDIMVDVLVVFLLVVLIRTFIFAPFRVHGPSMCDTFNVYDGECINTNGEHILTTRFSVWNIFGWSPTEIKRGDVIVFQDPSSEDGRYLIKRVIGLPGETIVIENGLVYLDENDELIQIEEAYLNEENNGNTQAFRASSARYTVPEGEYFVLGDNRIRSSDSRRCFAQNGCDETNSNFVPYEDVEGEVRLVIYPFSHFRWIPGEGN